MTDDGKQTEISLLDSLDGGWLKLSQAVMCDCGAAAQALAGLLEITNRETFVSIDRIASYARLPKATVRKHLVTLHESGWVEQMGRQRTKNGILRRTATIKVTKQTRQNLAPYAFLPWWACCRVRNEGGGKLRWRTRALLAVWMSQLCRLKAYLSDPDYGRKYEGEIDECLQEMEEARFRFSLTTLEHDTGLSRHSVIAAKRDLHRLGVLIWRGNGSDADLLLPNWRFRVVVTDIGGGRCHLDYHSGEKT